MARTLFIPLLLSLLGLLAPGCGSSQRVGTETDLAQAEYRKGLQQFEKGNHLEAINLFNQVRTRYPYSNYATLAELKIADSHYLLGKYIEAASAYKTFARLHPQHAERSYAKFKVGESHYKQIPGDWWFMPPSYERELGSTRDALRELEFFRTEHPQDQRLPEAEKMIAELQGRLAAFELYVAKFYQQRSKHHATRERARYLIRHYPKAPQVKEALLLQAQAELALGETTEALRTADELLRLDPAHPQARQLRDQLQPKPLVDPATSSGAAPAGREGYQPLPAPPVLPRIDQPELLAPTPSPEPAPTAPAATPESSGPPVLDLGAPPGLVPAE